MISLLHELDRFFIVHALGEHDTLYQPQGTKRLHVSATCDVHYDNLLRQHDPSIILMLQIVFAYVKTPLQD
ncbi:MAG: hypothetical protein PHR01_07080 [Sphaerochaetaceae bacterium]|nr:hypothetical protein [Sphaerochaetaceae bacterium]